MEREALEKIIAAWEALPGGNHGIYAVERWLEKDMWPAINVGRVALGREPKPPLRRKHV